MANKTMAYRSQRRVKQRPETSANVVVLNLNTNECGLMRGGYETIVIVGIMPSNPSSYPLKAWYKIGWLAEDALGAGREDASVS